MSDTQVLARNTTHFTLALVAQKVISFLYFTYLARLFAPAEIGQYVFALSFTTIFSVLIDVGLSYVLTTEVAKDRSLAQEYWSNSIGFKLFALVVTLILAWATINLLGVDGIALELVYIAFLIMVIDSLVLSAYSLIRAYHNLWWESLGTVIFQIVVAATGLTMSLFTSDLRLIILALVIGGLVNIIFSWNRLAQYKIKLLPKFDTKVIKKLLLLAWPFGTALVLARIYGYSDTVLLSFLAGDAAVGFYSVAYKVTFAWQFIASAFAASLLPGFSSYFVNDQSQLPKIFTRSVHYLNFVSFPLAAGFFVVGSPLIKTIYPEYEAAIIPLQILMFSLVFLFLTFPVGSLLSAGGRQKRNSLNLFFTVIVSVAANLVLIPIYREIGAAISSLISSIIYFILGWAVVSQLIKVNYSEIIYSLLKVFTSALAMGVVVYLLIPFMSLMALVFVGIVCYMLISLLLKSITVEEIKNFWALIFSRN